MPLATTLAGDKAAAQAGGVAAPYLGAALALKKTKHQKGFEKDIEAEEAKEAKDQGRLDQGQVAEAMNPIQAALTQQRAMMARGPQTGMAQQQQRELTRAGMMAQARVGSDLLAREAAGAEARRARIAQKKLQAAGLREQQKTQAIAALTSQKGVGQVGAEQKGKVAGGAGGSLASSLGGQK